MRYEVKTKG